MGIFYRSAQEGKQAALSAIARYVASDATIDHSGIMSKYDRAQNRALLVFDLEVAGERMGLDPLRFSSDVLRSVVGGDIKGATNFVVQLDDRRMRTWFAILVVLVLWPFRFLRAFVEMGLPRH
jgi:hypothetical protein